MVLLRAAFVSSLTLALLAIAGELSSIATAGEIWDGGGADSKWTTDANWDGLRSGISPPNNGSANIHMAGNDNVVSNVDIPYSINSLTFDAGSVSFFIVGQELTIGAGGIKNNDNSGQVVVAPVRMAAAQIWDAFAGPLTVGAFELDYILTIRGSSNINLNGAISGNGILIQNMAAGTSATMSGSAGNTYSGPTSINAGTMVLQKTSGVAIPGRLSIQGAGVVRLGASEQISHAPDNIVTVQGLLDLNGHTETTARLSLDHGGIVTTGTGKLIVGESITAADDSSPFLALIEGNVDLGGGAKTITAGLNSVLRLNGPISNGGVTFAGLGRTDLTGGANTYTGPTVVASGASVVLAKVGSDGAAFRGDVTIQGNVTLVFSEQILAAVGNEVFLDGGTLLFGSPVQESIQDLRLQHGSVSGPAPASLRVLGAINVLGAGSPSSIAVGFNLNGARTVDVQSDARLNVSGVISNGSLVKTGPGLLDLQNAANTYSGGTFLNEGTVWARNDGSLGAPASGIHFNGGVLRPQFATTARNITWGPLGGTFDVIGSDPVTLPTQSLSGPGPLTKLGDGALVLLAPQSYTGGTTVAGGNLVGNTQSLQGHIVLQQGGSIVFNQDNDGIYAGNLSGTGYVGKEGNGTVVLAGNNTNSGVFIGAGTLELDGGHAVGDFANVFLLNAAGAVLDLDDSNETIGTLEGGGAMGGNVELGSGTLTTGDGNGFIFYHGIISGTGGISKIGEGVWTLTGNNTYTGTTSIQTGQLRLGKANALSPNGSVNIAGGAALNLNNFDQSLGALSGNGRVFLGNGDLTVGAGDVSGNVSVSIEGAGSLTKTGTGTLSLDGINSYTGGTTVLDGTLRGPANKLQGNIVNHSIVEFAQTSDGSYGGALSGPGSLVKTGPGRATIASPATYTGATTVSAGTLTLPNTLNTPGGAIAIEANGTLEASGIIQRAIAGAGQLTATGNLVAGDLTSTNGFDLGGGVNVGSQGVTLLDADQVDLGGGTIAGGSLATLNGLELSGTFGGNGTVNGPLVNNGVVAGPAAPAALTFIGPVSGIGSFTGNIRILDSLSPGNSAAAVSFEHISLGDQALLTIELGGLIPGVEYDRLVATGAALLDGAMQVKFINGFSPQGASSFDILDWTNLSGAFDSLALPALTGSLAWNTSQLYTTGVISVVDAITYSADFDEDGDVDAADLSQWEGDFGLNALSDADDDGDSDGADYLAWQRQVGSGVREVLASQGVPEPASVGLIGVLLPVLAAAARRRFRRAAPPTWT